VAAKNQRPPLTRESILDATLQLAEERGVGAVSMREVARRLEVTPMALYNHVADKQALLDGLVERLLADMPSPDPDKPWREQLDTLARSLRKTARRYPDAFPMLLRRPANTPAAKRSREAIYEALRQAGVNEDDIPRAERVLSTFMIGFAASEAGGRFAHHSKKDLDRDLDLFAEAMAALLSRP
jgi:AcrR family transcriptional regulator